MAENLEGSDFASRGVLGYFRVFLGVRISYSVDLSVLSELLLGDCASGE